MARLTADPDYVFLSVKYHSLAGSTSTALHVQGSHAYGLSRLRYPAKLYTVAKRECTGKFSAYSQSSYSTLNAGRICSIIGLILGSLVVLIMLFYIIFFGAFFMEAMRNAKNY